MSEVKENECVLTGTHTHLYEKHDKLNNVP